jgi:hypothetical protein
VRVLRTCHLTIDFRFFWPDAAITELQDSLPRIIHEFPGRLEKSKEYLTEVTETTHGDHGEVPAMFSVHSVVKWFEDTDTLNTL